MLHQSFFVAVVFAVDKAFGAFHKTLCYGTKDEQSSNADCLLILAMCAMYACSQVRHSQKHSQKDARSLQSLQPWHFPLTISKDEQYCISLMQPKGHPQRGPSGISKGREASSSEKTL